MPSGTMQASIHLWAQQFRGGELSVEEVQERFAAIADQDVASLRSELRRWLQRSRQELDAIRYGMCEAGQRGEIERIFRELEALMEHSETSSRRSGYPLSD